MDRADAEGFVADFNRTYDEKTELRRIFGHTFYESEDGEDDKTPSRDKDALRYFQIGRRTALPTSVVTEGRYAYVSDSVVGALCEGEKSFVAERLAAAAEEDEIPTVEADPTRTVEAALEHVETPDYVLLPRDERHDEAVADWEEEERLRRFGDSSYLRGPGDDEENEADCWLHRYDPTPEVNDAFVLEDGGVTFVQKKGKNASPPDFDYVKEYDGIDDDMPLMVYFGDEKREGDGRYDEFFDILYRVVVSEPVVCEGGVCAVRSA
ncbi:MAG: hypothetical protein U5J64_12680 [Halobacteriales archaeon]|nr:hypothetical protein [Halobacteriales archaeon]